LLSVSGKGVEVVTSAEVASSPVLDSEVSGTGRAPQRNSPRARAPGQSEL